MISLRLVGAPANRTCLLVKIDSEPCGAEAGTIVRRRTKMPAWTILPLVAVAGCAAIEDRSDYHRHSMSDLREDWRRPGILLFEATSSGLYPADSEAAEATRMKWLAGWMKRTGHCPAGWEILSRTAIDPAEVHARRHDLRYELRCTEQAARPAH